MKKFLALILVLVMCLSLAACGSGQDKDTSGSGNDGGSQSGGAQWGDANGSGNNGGSTADPNQGKYDQIIQWLKDGEYDSAISQIERMKQDALKAENAAKGIREITITMDNWSEYFEIVDARVDDYYLNSFKEITTINCSTGIKLKDQYKLVQDDNDRSTSVAFEADLQRFNAEVTYDFDNGTCTVGEQGEAVENIKSFTNTYTPGVYTKTDMDPGDGAVGIGYRWQGIKEDGTVQNEMVSYFLQMTRAQGTLYIYEN